MTSAKQIYLGSQRGPALPYDSEVEYLESTGTQWIDTGVKMRNYLSFDVVFTPTGNSPGQLYDTIYGVYNGANINVASVSCIVPSDIVGRSYGNRYMDVSKEVPISDTSYKNKLVVYHQANDSFTVSVDGTTYNYGAFASQQIAESTETIMLFGIRSVAFGDRYAKARLFAFKVYDGSVLVRDFIPVRFTTELGQSEGAMYDRVSGQLFRNSGTGVFGFGTDIAGGGYKCLGYSPLRFSRFSRLWKEAA